MEHSKPAVFPNWASRDLIDILSHHVCPSLRLDRDSVVCRLVCSSWRAAFVPRALKANPAALATRREPLTTFACLVSKLTLDDANESLLEWLRNDVVLASGSMSSITSLTIGMPHMSMEQAKIIAEIFAHLKHSRLRDLTLSVTKDEIPDDVFRIVVNAIADTEAPIRNLNLFHFPIKASLASDFFSALLRGPKTLRKIEIRKREYSSSLVADLVAFLRDNQNVRKIEGYGLLYGGDPSSLSDLLAVDNHLEYLDFSGCGTVVFSSIISSLRTNRTLRKLEIGRFDLIASDFAPLVDSLCENDAIENLVLEIDEKVPDIARHLNRLFVDRRSALLNFRLKCSRGCTQDFSSLFQGGLRFNTTLKHLEADSVPLNFIMQLAECIIDGNGLKGLEKLAIAYNSMDTEAALMLSTAALCLPRLKNFQLVAVKCEPNVAEPLATLIEKSLTLEIAVLYSIGVGSAGLIRICDALLHSRAPIYEIALGGEQHTEEALLSVCNLVSKKDSLEYLDFSGTRVPITLKPNFEAALMQNDKMYRMEVCFVREESEDDDSRDLKAELVEASMRSQEAQCR